MEKMMSTQELVTSQQGVADYLKNVYTLESNLYSLKREEGRLKWDIRGSGRPRMKPIEPPQFWGSTLR